MVLADAPPRPTGPPAAAAGACRRRRAGRRLPPVRLPPGDAASGSPAGSCNTPQGVTIEVEGDARRRRRLRRRDPGRAPPAGPRRRGACDRSRRRGRPTVPHRSQRATGERTRPSLRDLATCAECLREIFDPATAAIAIRSPTARTAVRATIIEGLPYDRARTSMRRSRCARPAGRSTTTRPTAASTPSRSPARRAARGSRCWDRTAATDCDATTRCAGRGAPRGRDRRGQGPRRLPPAGRCATAQRPSGACERKHRAEKPFAVMFPSLRCATEAMSVRRPSARCWRRRSARSCCSPQRRTSGRRRGRARQPWLGAMLPYTPLHHLLLAEPRLPGRRDQRQPSDEPIVIDEDEALRASPASPTSSWCTTGRSCGRSTIRWRASSPAGRRCCRRARGYAPAPGRAAGVRAAASSRSAATSRRPSRCRRRPASSLSQHLGDLDTAEAAATPTTARSRPDARCHGTRRAASSATCTRTTRRDAARSSRPRRRGPAPSRPRRRLHGRAWRWRRRCSASPGTAPARDRRHGLGRRVPRS